MGWALTHLGLYYLLESQVYLRPCLSPLLRPLLLQPGLRNTIKTSQAGRSLSTGVEVSLARLRIKATWGLGVLFELPLGISLLRFSHSHEVTILDPAAFGPHLHLCSVSCLPSKTVSSRIMSLCLAHCMLSRGCTQAFQLARGDIRWEGQTPLGPKSGRH